MKASGAMVEINAAAMRAGVDPCQASSSFLSASSEEVLGAQAETAPDDFLARFQDARSILETGCGTREEAVVLANKLVRALGPPLKLHAHCLSKDGVIDDESGARRPGCSSRLLSLYGEGVLASQDFLRLRFPDLRQCDTGLFTDVFRN